nr:DNA repair protein RecO C-terminal domain-containing protein [Allomuricauda sp.]
MLYFFLAEMLGNSIQEQEKDAALFNYLEYSFLWLDEHELNPNFHLVFLLNLTKYLGFYPDTYFNQAPYFDLQEGGFSEQPTLNPLIQGEILTHFKTLLGINFDALSTLKIKKTQRRELLKMVILYFRLHLHGFRKPKSLDVLNAVFE